MSLATMTAPDVPDSLDRIESWCVRLTRPIAFLGVLGMLIVSGITMIDVLARWLFSSGMTALNEVVAMTFAVTVTACIPAGFAQRVNLKVDLLENMIQGRWRAWLTAIGDLLLLAVVVLLTWCLFKFSVGPGSVGRTTVILGWPIPPFIQASGALLAVGAVVQGVVTASALRRALAVPGDGATSRGVKIYALVVGSAVLALTAAAVIDVSFLAAFAIAHPLAALFLGCLVAWAVLLVLVPVAAAMGLTGFFGTMLYLGFNPSTSVFATEISGFLTNINVAVLPLFLMMGSFSAAAGIADDAYTLAQAVLSRFRGGLAMATIGGCAAFGAVTGSSVATAATIGRVAFPEMSARGYAPALSSGSVAAGGTLGALVPPSGPLILFALLTEASIGQLFIAAVIPAGIVIVAYLLTVNVFVRVHLDAAPPAAKSPRGDLARALRRCGPLLGLFGCVVGGMYFGVFTVTEAAAVGAFGAFLVAVFRGKLRGGAFWTVMTETTQVTAMLYMLIFGALIFAFFVELTGIAEISMRFLSGLDVTPLLLVAMLLFVFVALGTFMDAYAIMIVTIPIVTPLVLGAGYDLIWWGIVNLFVIEIGAISPPFGLNMFVLKSIGNIPLATIFYGATWFCIAAILVLAILVLFPQLSLWLPSTMTFG